jgi:hypothetical protein
MSDLPDKTGHFFVSDPYLSPNPCSRSCGIVKSNVARLEDRPQWRITDTIKRLKAYLISNQYTSVLNGAKMVFMMSKSSIIIEV